jgi:hypothetical protein
MMLFSQSYNDVPTAEGGWALVAMLLMTTIGVN